MSMIGPGSIGGMNLAGSIAGSQRTGSGDELKSHAAERKLQQDQQTLSAQSLGDVAQTDRSADRDADGRMPYMWQEPGDGRPDEENDDRSPVRDLSDPLGERGFSLDVTA